MQSICTTSRNTSTIAQSIGEKYVLIENDLRTFSWGSLGEKKILKEATLSKIQVFDNYKRSKTLYCLLILTPKDRGNAFLWKVGKYLRLDLISIVTAERTLNMKYQKFWIIE